MKILVVDDSKVWCSLMIYNLERQGYNVTAVNDIDEAVRYLNKDQYDAVLLDLHIHDWLPEEDTVPYIRKVYGGPIIVVTGREKKPKFLKNEFFLPKLVAEDVNILNSMLAMAVHCDNTRILLKKKPAQAVSTLFGLLPAFIK